VLGIPRERESHWAHPRASCVYILAKQGRFPATLNHDDNWGLSGGVQGGLKLTAGLGVGTVWNGFGFGTTQGGGGHKSTSVSVSRGSSQHFDIGLSFDVALSTSDSPYLAGQPSDLIIGGGANIRFIEAIEVYARPYEGDGLCLRGFETVQFLPETVTTYVMSVYEIEMTMLRLGDALRKHATGAMNFTGNITADDLEKQLGIWEKVLADYRATTTSTSATSVAEQLDDVLKNVLSKFRDFWTDLKDDTSSELATFVADGIKKLQAREDKPPPKGSAPGYDGNDAGTNEQAKQLQTEHYKFHEDDFKSDAGDVGTHVTYATANDCDAAAGVLHGTTGNLCHVYHDIGKKADLVTTLMAVCSFDTYITSVQTFCEQNGKVPSVAANSPKPATPMSVTACLIIASSATPSTTRGMTKRSTR
jgi:hypothetical protein